jgi:acyl dehydratase
LTSVGGSRELASLLRDTRERLGRSADDVPAGVQVADLLNIGRVVEATGDDNPLYLDPEYGARSQWGTLLAPPAFVLAVRVPESSGTLDVSGGGLDLLSQVEICWQDHIRLGDRVSSSLRLAGAEPGPEWRGRETVEVTSRAVYSGDHGVVATATGVVRVYPLRFGEELFVERALYRYEDDEIERIAAGLDSELPRRGSRPRFGSETAVGEDLPAVVRGPFTWSELVTWIVAEGRAVAAGNLHHRELVSRPGSIRANPVTGWPVADRREAREDPQACADVGFPAPCARPALIVALATQLVSSWMGDDAFLRRLTVSLESPVLYGDTVFLSGCVADRLAESSGDREYDAVRLELAARNQIGQPVFSGSALLFLPEPGRPVVLPVE